MLKYYKIK